MTDLHFVDTNLKDPMFAFISIFFTECDEEAEWDYVTDNINKVTCAKCIESYKQRSGV